MSGHAVLALALFGAWVVLAGAGRILLQRHRTGDTGFRFATEPPGSLQWWANRIAGTGSVAVGIAAPVADLLGLWVIAPLEHLVLRGVAAALAVTGIVCTCAAQLAMGSSWRIGVDPSERTTLVATGPFAVVRNPIFTAAALAFTGLALTVPNAVSLVGLALVLAGFQLQVRGVEEPYLQSVHGQRYQQYAARVGRFIPGIGRLRAPRN